MLKAIMDSTKTWKQIVDALATLLTDAQFVANTNGFSLRQLDTSKAAMIDLYLPAEVFQHYECDQEYRICLGVDELTRISKRMSGDEKLEFSVDDAEKRFHIRLISQVERVFKIQMKTPTEDIPKKMPAELDVRAEMYADAFRQAVRDIGVVSTHIRLSADSKSITFRGQGETDEAEVKMVVGEESALFDLQVKNDSTAAYALSYLSEISKAISGDTLVLHFGNTKPMILEFGIAEKGKIVFVLAPRIDRR